MPPTQTPPQWIAAAYHELGWLLEDLDECTADEVRQWRADVRTATRAERETGKVQNWSALAESVNEILTAEGYPEVIPTN
ncbi:MAG: hypothetical protein ACOYYS_19220 [Chloroflexota bacterium]